MGTNWWLQGAVGTGFIMGFFYAEGVPPLLLDRVINGALGMGVGLLLFYAIPKGLLRLTRLVLPKR